MRYFLLIILMVVAECSKKTSQITVVEPFVKHIEERENPPEIIPEDIPETKVPTQWYQPFYNPVEKIVKATPTFNSFKKKAPKK